MICQSCHSNNLHDAEFCSTCGVLLEEQAREGDWLAGMVAEVAETPPPATPDPTPPPPQHPTSSLDATTPIYEPDPPPAPGAPTPPQPALTGTDQPGAAQSAAAQPTTAQPPNPHALAVRPTTRKSSIIPIVATCTAIAVVVIIAAVALGVGRSSNDTSSNETSSPTVDATPATDDRPDTSNPVTSGNTTSGTATSGTATSATVPTTDAEQPESTQPAVTEPAPTPTSAPITTPITTPTDPAAIPPLPDEPGPVDATGSPQVLANVLPSGLTYNEVSASFLLAQEFGDALALEDWDAARSLAPGLADSDDADFLLGYGATNRISLMLVDATAIVGGHQVVAVSVAVENNGAQTSLYCITWDVDPDARTIEQVGGRRLARWTDNAQPEAIRNDVDAMETVNRCTAS